MIFGRTIDEFFDKLLPPENLPPDVDILWPYQSSEVRRVLPEFYGKFFGDNRYRTFLVGINPGRFGAGVTGICFTDPIRLAQDCGIRHNLPGGRELSSDFVYRMIAVFGGPEAFYRHFYITALSPVGFLREGRNLNYYDVKGLPGRLESWMADAMARQIRAGANTRVAFSLGQGANLKHLTEFNAKYGFFENILPLPHPRWIMQYRRKRLDEFIDLYCNTLNSVRADGRTG